MNRKTTEYYAGCLLGGAVGDALGAPVEFRSLAEIRVSLGPAGVTGYPPGHQPAKITDDTQMTLFTAEGLLRAYARGQNAGICDPVSVVHHAYIRWLRTQGLASQSRFSGIEPDGWLISIPALHHLRAPGNTCLSALQSGVMGSITESINSSKGCGGVMRVAPVGLLSEEVRAFDMACKIAATTHGHPSGYLAAGALACIIARIVAGDSVRNAIDVACRRLAARPQHEECLRAVSEAVRIANVESLPPAPEVVERLGRGWVAEEALAISLYCALVAGDDFSRGVLLAVNHGGDSDSTGAITGNILGTLLGRSAIPAAWLQNLELRDEIQQMADDLITLYREDDAWAVRYPGW